MGERVVGQGRDEAGDGGDLMSPRRVGGHDEAEAVFGQGEVGVDVELSAQ